MNHKAVVARPCDVRIPEVGECIVATMIFPRRIHNSSTHGVVDDTARRIERDVSLLVALSNDIQCSPRGNASQVFRPRCVPADFWRYEQSAKSLSPYLLAAGEQIAAGPARAQNYSQNSGGWGHTYDSRHELFGTLAVISRIANPTTDSERYDRSVGAKIN